MATLPQQFIHTNRPSSTVARWLPNAGSRPYLIGPPVGRMANLKKASFISFPHENEDARITGGTRSLVRRLMALNVEGSLSGRKPGRMSAASPVSSARMA